jgi:hypothetical protein
MAQKIVPHLWFDGTAEEAVERHVSLIPGSSLGEVMPYGKAGFEIQTGSALGGAGGRALRLAQGPVRHLLADRAAFPGDDARSRGGRAGRHGLHGDEQARHRRARAGARGIGEAKEVGAAGPEPWSGSIGPCSYLLQPPPLPARGVGRRDGDFNC